MKITLRYGDYEVSVEDESYHYGTMVKIAESCLHDIVQNKGYYENPDK